MRDNIRVKRVIDNYLKYGMDYWRNLPEHDKEGILVRGILNKFSGLRLINGVNYENEYNNAVNALNTIERNKTYCYIVARIIINYIQGINDRRQLEIVSNCM